MRGSPYWVSLASGCTLGYRKGPKGGVWLAKIVRDALRQQTTLGLADDALDPDGVLAISYADAQTRAREWLATVTKPARSPVHRSLYHSRRGCRLPPMVPRHRPQVHQ